MKTCPRTLEAFKRYRVFPSAWKPGQRLAIIGPNGAGKTTLFNILNGQLLPTTGQVYLFGQDITRKSTHRRAHLGMARSFQVSSAFLGLTVLDNALLATQGTRPSRFQMFRPMTAYKDVYADVERLLEPWGLCKHRNSVVKDLAYGDQRKLEIALTLASNPRFLLLDEPSTGLTAAESAYIGSMINTLGPDTTVLLVAHDIDLVFGVAERIMVLHYGQVIADGMPHDISANPRVREIYMGLKEAVGDAGGWLTYIPTTERVTCSRAFPLVLGRARWWLSWVATVWERPPQSVRLSGFNPPRRGTIRFKGQEITAAKSHRIAQLGIGLVPQGRQIFPSLSVQENLTVSARGSRKSSPWDLQGIYSLFPVLRSRAKNRGNQLSGGEQQMLAIGRALMTNPDLLLMDEPSEGLAPVIVKELTRIIAGLKDRGFSILLVEQKSPHGIGTCGLRVRDRPRPNSL